MALSKQRVISGGETTFPWEREAIDLVVDTLPDTDPHFAWPLHELHDPGTGRLYELDLLVLSRTALFLVEIKSNPGVLTGDLRDWTFTEPDGRPQHRDCPYPTTNHKAKVLAGLLRRRWGGRGGRPPFVQPLVFLSHESVQVRLRNGQPPWLTTRTNVRSALVNGLPDGRGTAVNRPVMRAVCEVLRAVGLKPRKGSRVVGGYSLADLIDEGAGYQEHRARNAAIGDQARVRSYLVPRQTSVERRQLLQRAAEREAQVLARLGRHPNILGYRSFVPDAPLGPALLFDAFEGGQPLDAFLRDEPDLPFDDRLTVLQQVVEAVEHCHRAEYLHRNLSPGSVLVRRNDGRIEVRVHRFQTAAHGVHTSLGTVHVHDLALDRDRLYQAPEILVDPAKATVASDVFGVGALTYVLMTGLHPAAGLPERERLLTQQEGLRFGAVRSDLAALDEALAFATAPYAVQRADSALGWLEEVFLEHLTAPEPSEEHRADPYEAKPGDRLGGGLEVVRLLGSGATARVFHVRKDDRSYALKVPHDEGAAARLLDEADTLRRLRHPNIVQLHEVVRLGDRSCLLMEFAGEQSVGDLLREQGTVDLDKARRWGDDLLQALQHLEEHGVTHRDIKPGNLGFTSQSRKARHLALYDFSLSTDDPTKVTAGTPEWRDPWLHLRGRWDPSADRYAAGAVLHRMLAGVRPELQDSGDQRGTVRVEAERLDAAVRDRLASFFGTAFAPEASDRYASADAMRTEWVALFATPAPAPEVDAPSDSDLLAAARPDTRIDALPLSSRARNALDRAGVLTVAELLGLPRNHLSAIRGIGHKVAVEIVEMAERLREQLSLSRPPGLLPDFPGPVLPLQAPEVGLDAAAQRTLEQAALTTTADLAACPRARLERLVGDDLTTTLESTLQRLAAEMPAPGTVGEWVGALLRRLKSERTKADERVRVLVGLDPLPTGEDDAGRGARSARQVAVAFGIGQPQMHSSLQFLRQRWTDEPAVDPFLATVAELLAELGPAVSFARLGAELARRRSPGVDPDADALAEATSAVRLAAEVRPTPIQWRRIGAEPWAALDGRALDVLAELAEAADQLAVREPLPSTESVRAALTERAAGSLWADEPPDRLVAIAAEASRGAAASARLELYPRGMAAARAVALSQPVLVPPAGGEGLTAEAVQRSVSARYAQAAPLPGRPDLDRLLAPLGLAWDADKAGYLRPGVAHGSTTGTVQLPTRMISARTHQALAQSPDALEAREFADSLRRGVEAGRFRVVQVRADWAERVVEELAADLGAELRSLDHALWQHVEQVAAARKVKPGVLSAADRDGPSGPHWERLRTLMSLAADALLDEILTLREQPQLLVHPGAFERYGLADPISRLSLRAQAEEGAGIVLLVPSHRDDPFPSINGRLPVPTETAGQRLRMPESWLRGAHRAPAN